MTDQNPISNGQMGDNQAPQANTPSDQNPASATPSSQAPASQTSDAPAPIAPNPADQAAAQNTQTAPAAQGPAEPEQDKTPANFQLGALLPAEFKTKLPEHNLNLDGDKFLRVLAGSISLKKDEKIRIIQALPTLKQFQVDELINIFEEEKFKFSQLPKSHVQQLERLAKIHLLDWQLIENEGEAAKRKEDEDAKADEIRKSLGL